MSHEPTNAEKIRRLPWILATNTSNSVFCMLTIFGAIFTLFLDELGLPKRQIGFLFSLFPFCGVLALFAAPWVSRVGPKRMFFIFWGTRKVFISLILLAPWIAGRYGSTGAFYSVSAIILAFAVCRAIGETAWFPWMQEAIPPAIRGKFSAVNMICTNLAAAAAVWGAGFALDAGEGLERFVYVMAVGVVFGFGSALASGFIAGGGATVSEEAHYKGMAGAAKDRSFMVSVLGYGLVTLGVMSIERFIPLFLRQEVGLSSAFVVRLQVWGMLGGVVSSYAWGWAADRFGSKPVMLTALNLIALLPIPWMLIPRHSPWSATWAVGLSLAGGVTGFGWNIAAVRHLFNTMVPPKKKTAYLALYCAWIGIMGGVGPLAAGQALEWTQGLQGQWLVFPLDAYMPLFLACMVVRFAAVGALSRLPSNGELPTRKFAGMFLRGNPLAALESLVRYNLASGEESRADTIARLADARSPLNVDEIIESLRDPSFNVRYEAVVSTARALPDERLVDALIGIVEGEEPDLAIAAAWAVGRLGNARAVPALRKTLASSFPLLQARSARALAMLGDQESAPAILETFRAEADPGQRVAYAAALGALRVAEATEGILAYLREQGREGLRLETALALARIVGDERYFIRRWRAMGAESNTTTARAVSALRRRLRRLGGAEPDALALCDRCADAFARDDPDGGARALADLSLRLARGARDGASRAVLRECAARLDELGAARREYVLLALHTLDAITRPDRKPGE